MAKTTRNKLYDWRANTTALAALFVSLVSLVTGIYSQYVDRQYKELSIEPHIVEYRYPTDLYVRFTNKGIGPAEIKRIVFSSNQGCSDLQLSDQGSWPVDLQKVAFGSLINFIENAFAKIPGGVPKVLKLKMTALLPGQVLAVGEVAEFFSLYDAREILAAVGEENVGTTLVAFGEQPLPFGFEYCSLTGKKCFGINMNYITKKCSLKY